MSIESTGLSKHETPRARGMGHNRGSPLERRTYTLEEVARLLGLSRNSTYVAAREGRLPVAVIKIGKRMLVSRAALDRFLDAGDAA